jgi:hypothetical protein
MVFDLRLLWQQFALSAQGQFFGQPLTFHVRRSRVLESNCQQFDISVLLTQCSLSQAQRYLNFRVLTSIQRDTL